MRNGYFGLSGITSAASCFAEQPVDLVDVPARLAELEGVAAGGSASSAACEPLVVALEVRRQLPEDGPQLRRPRERLDPLVEAGEPAFEVGEPLEVRDVAAHLDREAEVLGRLLDPARDRVAPGQAVEGVVDLDRVEERRVVLEPPRGQGSPSGRRARASAGSSSPSSRCAPSPSPCFFPLPSRGQAFGGGGRGWGPLRAYALRSNRVRACRRDRGARAPRSTTRRSSPSGCCWTRCGGRSPPSCRTAYCCAAASLELGEAPAATPAETAEAAITQAVATRQRPRSPPMCYPLTMDCEREESSRE